MTEQNYELGKKGAIAPYLLQLMIGRQQPCVR